MKIAIIGIRGIPFTYSGFEVFAEELSVGLAKKNHKLTVYCRKNYFDNILDDYKKVELIYLPTIKTKYFETIIHSFFSTIHACIVGKYDIIYYLGVSNSLFTFFPRLFGIKTLINIDGLDWKREKWSYIGKIYLKFSEYLSSFLPNMTITDSLYVKNYYQRQYRKSIDYLPYGFFTQSKKKKLRFNNLNLKKNEYFIWVGRFVPDNKLEEIVIAFKKIKTNYKLIVVGDDLYESNYKKYISALTYSDPRIILTGFISHSECAYIMKNSLAYIETKRSGGAHPSLIDAMGLGCLIISNNHKANKSIIKNLGFYYSIYDPVESLGKIIKKIIFIKNSLILRKMRAKVRNEAEAHYSWTKIVDHYEKLFLTLIQQHKNQPKHYHWWIDMHKNLF